MQNLMYHLIQYILPISDNSWSLEFFGGAFLGTGI